MLRVACHRGVVLPQVHPGPRVRPGGDLEGVVGLRGAVPLGARHGRLRPRHQGQSVVAANGLLMFYDLIHSIRRYCNL